MDNEGGGEQAERGEAVEAREVWMEAALKAQAERDEARKLLNELCEIVGVDLVDEPMTILMRSQRLVKIKRLLRERHASWPGWKR